MQRQNLIKSLCSANVKFCNGKFMVSSHALLDQVDGTYNWLFLPSFMCGRPHMRKPRRLILQSYRNTLSHSDLLNFQLVCCLRPLIYKQIQISWYIWVDVINRCRWNKTNISVSFKNSDYYLYACFSFNKILYIKCFFFFFFLLHIVFFYKIYFIKTSHLFCCILM